MSERPGWLRRNVEVLVLTAILILGAYLRFPELGRESFWGDEIMLAKAAVLSTVGETMADVQIPHSVGYPVFLHYWMRIGSAEEMVRFPSAVAGILATYLLYLFVKRLSCARIGLAAALIIALAAPQIRFSREAAAYSIQNAVLVGSALVWLRSIQTNRWFHWIAFSLLATVCHYLHPLASSTSVGWFLLTLLVWWRGVGVRNAGFSVEMGSVNLRRWFSSLILFGVLILPQTLRNMEGAEKNVLTSAAAITLTDYGEELTTLLGGSWLPLFPLVVVGAIFLFRTSIVLGLAIAGWACGTLAVWAAFSWAQSYHFDYHYFLSQLPAFAILAAFGIEGFSRRLCWLGEKTLKCNFPKWLAPATAVAAGAVGILMLPAGVAETKRSWPNYRAAGAFLANRLNPEDRYYVKPDYWLPAKIGYYLRGVSDREVGIEVFGDKALQKEIDNAKGTLYVVTPQAFRKSPVYRSRSFHGAAVNWREPCDGSPMDYWAMYNWMHSSTGEVTGKDLLSEAKEFEQAGDLDTACKILIEAASKSPHLYAVQRRRAEVLTRLGRHDEAVEAYDAAFERAPRGDRWWMSIEKANNLFSQGLTERGLETLHQALDETTDESEEAFVHEAIGEELFARERFDEAAVSFQKSLDLWEGERESSLFHLGEIAARRGNPDEALAYFRRAAAASEDTDTRARKRMREMEREGVE